MCECLSLYESFFFVLFYFIDKTKFIVSFSFSIRIDNIDSTTLKILSIGDIYLPTLHSRKKSLYSKKLKKKHE